MTIQITQGTLSLPLLRALRDAGGTATANDISAVAIAAMGGDSSDKKHRTAAANALGALRWRSVITSAKRGEWTLTDAGRTAIETEVLPPMVYAPTRKGATEAPDAPSAPDATEAPVASSATMSRVTDDPAETAGTETAGTETVAATPAKRRLKVANAPVTPVTPVKVPSWLDDEGIRALAIESTECFGAWSAKSGECGKCPLAGWCRNAKAATLSLLAAKLHTENPANPEPVKPSVATLDEAVSTANAPDASRTAPPDGLVGLSMKARHDGVCAVSGRPIKAGDSIKYLAGFGVYHADETPPATVK